MKAESTTYSALITCLGIIFLLPPVALIFDKPTSVFSIPLAAFYVFGIWLLLILIAVVVARALPRDNN